MARFRARSGRVGMKVDTSLWEKGAVIAFGDLQRDGERIVTNVGEAVVREVRGRWPVGPGDGGHTRDGIEGRPSRTKTGRFYYLVKVPFPGGFYELGTKRQPPRPILRPVMAAAYRYIRSG